MDRRRFLAYGFLMLHLTILRHAKSSWATPGMADIDRPLNERGRQQAAALRHWMKEQSFQCDAIVCSPAQRTRETLDILRPALDGTEPDYDKSLYTGATQIYLDALAGRSAKRVLMIGHNPTCDEMARALSSPDGAHAGRLANRHFGTCNLVTIGFDAVEWTDIRRGALEVYLTPSDIARSSSQIDATG